MKRSLYGTILAFCAFWPAFSQPEALPKFEAADIRVSPKTSGPMGQFPRNLPVRAGRYEVKNASMVDLIRMAYGYDNDKVMGGPSWLEMDRFDITAKVPAESNAEMHKQMLQALLADRFRLVVRKESRPLPTYVLLAGKKPQLKEANGSEQTGCRPKESSGPGGPGVMRLTMMSDSAQPTTITLGPGMTVEYNCRNISMEAFAANLRSMIGANLGSNPIKDETGLKGHWNFDLTYSMQMFGPMMQGDTGSRISTAAAVEKQLGLKLEERQEPTPVIVVESVNRKPSENPPGTAEILPPIALPTEFEVASVKASEAGGRGMRYSVQPGGRLVSEGMTLRFLLQRAFNTFNTDAIAGLPSFADSERYDIVAKAPAVGGAALTNMDMETVAPLLLALLKERFQLKYHTEDRPVTAYTLVAAKPKMKKADADSRTTCKNTNAPPPAAPGSRVLTCTNVTMDEFAERLQGLGPDLSWPVANATGLEGGWDLRVTFTQRAMPMMGGRGGPGPGAEANPGGAMPTASDPTDSYTIFEALEKQVGLKLEKQKRPMPVIVIDHIEQKPTEN